MPLCLALCPIFGAISYERNEYDYPYGRVRIVPELCVGCGLCAGRRYEVAVVDSERCEGCQECIEECPFDAIDLVRPELSGTGKKFRKSKKLKAWIDPDRCVGCELCHNTCNKTGALTLKPVNLADYDPLQIEGCPSDAIAMVPRRDAEAVPETL